MVRQCSICGKKGRIVGKRKKLRGKYHPLAKKRKYPNLQWVLLPSGKRVLACTKCIKRLSKDYLPSSEKIGANDVRNQVS